MISVLESSFLTSASSIENTPPPRLSEIVFIGRSNVGKSTLINLLTESKALAKSSSTPGKTQLINYFETTWKRDEERISLWLVDLPGFGYAKVSKNMRKSWGDKLARFLHERRSIKLFIQLVDSRHPELEIDSEAWAMIARIMRGDQRAIRVFTKVDKLTKNDARKLEIKHKDCSLVSQNRSGIAELRERILREVLGEECAAAPKVQNQSVAMEMSLILESGYNNDVMSKESIQKPKSVKNVNCKKRAESSHKNPAEIEDKK
ncbi:MAG: ribosome biogenesis GTP-binding protein YihA/YsxC [Wolinella sp.]